MDSSSLIRIYLILRAQTGDEQAFEQIVRLYHSKLVYFLRRLIADESRVDDILQDVWLKVWRKLPMLQSPEAFPVWLYRIARNQAASEFRGEPHTVPLEEDVAEEIAPENNDLLSDGSIANLHRSLERLRPEHREVLVLQFLEGLSYEEIAHVLGCQLGTVRSRIHYAKIHVRQLMEETSHE